MKKSPEIDSMYKTMFSELMQRSVDGALVSEFSPEGSFIGTEVKGRKYWYYEPRGGARKYVGPSTPDLDEKVENFRSLKDTYRSRRKLVSTLKRQARLPGADPFVGDVIEKLADAGLFRLRAVLVGTVAYQTYSALLGVRLPSQTMATDDADFAQFHSVSAAIEDTLPPIMEVLREVDETFQEIPHQADGRRATTFQNSKGYKVEFLTPNTGSEDYLGHPARMPALGGASAEPLRFLDYLIHEPDTAIVLHKGGVVVNVPQPAKYAIHKLIVASRRRDDKATASKRDKDVMQAVSIARAMIETRRHEDLAEAFVEAWERGPSWRKGLATGLGYMRREDRDEVEAGLREGLEAIGEKPEGYLPA
uniref:nucleotidyltransferase family protein n=1 Tax=Stappia sp. TaxID=1870903 RepID=UPI003BAA570B